MSSCVRITAGSGKEFFLEVPVESMPLIFSRKKDAGLVVGVTTAYASCDKLLDPDGRLVLIKSLEAYSRPEFLAKAEIAGLVFHDDMGYADGNYARLAALEKENAELKDKIAGFKAKVGELLS